MYGGTANQPDVLGAVGAFIPPVRVPATFGTYPGPSRNPIGTGAVPSVAKVTRALPNSERRTAAFGQARSVVAVTVARASDNARRIVNAIPRFVPGTPNAR